MTGSGTVNDPYIIYDVNDLQDMSLDLAAYYELANDIDASETVTWNAGAGFVPVGAMPLVNAFRGHFDGKNHKITGLYINRPATNDVGLFGEVIEASFANVSLEVEITGATGTGGLVGCADGDNITISNCSTAGIVTGGGFVGGLAGAAFETTIVDCSSSATVTGGASVGGLVGGLLARVYITNCSSSGSVSAIRQVGGLVGVTGWGPDYAISDCHSSSTVEATGDRAGGLIGEMWGSGTVSNSYATGDVTCVDGTVGGFVGSGSGVFDRCYATGSVISTVGFVGSADAGGFAGDIGGHVSNCYARGNVTGVGQEEVGGFVGYNWATVTNCYSTGIPTGDAFTGGFCGENDSTITDCFWDTETSGIATSDGGTGKTTAEMKDKSTFTIAGWDFTTIWSRCPGVNEVYPCLIGITPSCRYVSKHHIPWHPTEPNRGKTLSRMGSL